MATSKGFFGHRRGSTKSFTFSVLNGKQVTREKAEKVKNPRTYGQAYQRCKMATLTKAYKKMKSICDHSFENKQYGAQSMAYFLSANSHRKLKFYNKVRDLLYPSNFLISEGTLKPSSSMATYDNSKKVVISFDAKEKAEDFFKSLGLSKKGMITIVYFDANSDFYWVRFKIKSDSVPAGNASLEDLKKMYTIEGRLPELTVENDNISFSNAIGAGVILSDLEDNKWKRSTCEIVTLDELDTNTDECVSYYFGGNSTKILNGGLSGVSGGGSSHSGGGGGTPQHP